MIVPCLANQRPSENQCRGSQHSNRRWDLRQILTLALIFGLPFLPAYSYHISRLQIDATDFLFVAILLGSITSVLANPTNHGGNLSSSHFSERSFLQYPLMPLWVAFGILLSAAYINGVLGQGYLTDPVRISYQLYRYCWKGILLFPLIVMFLRRSSDFRAIANLLIISTLVEAVAGILQARSGFLFKRVI